jgi:cis-3-alkyl-4-acyloxetan-2-one decarboxylase
MNRLPAPPLPAWLDAMLPFERYALQVGQYRMHVMETGEGQPVLLLHGNPTWGFLYRKVAAKLAGASLRLIMPDLVGLGLSDKPPAAAHTLEMHSGQITRLIDALGLDRFIFVGQDWGGPIGGCAIAENPRRCAGLVVLNTVLGPPKPGFRPTAFHRFARMPIVSDLAFRGAGFPQVALWFAQGDRSSIRGAVARAYRYPLRGLRNNAAPLALARMVPDSMEHPSIARLRRCLTWAESFREPSAIVWGDRDPVLGRVRTFIERLLPSAPVTRTQAGHFLQEEVPDEIAAAIRGVAGKIREAAAAVH